MDENAPYPKASSGKPVALEKRDVSNDGRRYSPSVARNKQLIRDVFIESMPSSGRILEIASGTGEHGAFIAEGAPALNWTYSDLDLSSRISQEAWVATNPDQLTGPILIDASQDDWALDTRFAGMACINMIHISPIEATSGLMKGAARYLAETGKLFLYGPYARNGVIAPSNARFDEDLKRRDPAWGVRDLDREIIPMAADAGLTPHRIVEMPANNMSVIFSKTK